MGLLTNLARGLVRGADRMAEFTSKRGPRSHNKGRGARKLGYLTLGGKFIKIKEMVPEFVVPNLTGFKLKPYVSYKTPKGTEPPLTAKQLFMDVVAPQIEKDIKGGTFDPHNLEKYGYESTQEGKLFQLFPKNYVR
ncbi:39S ribosomal protein L41, mitochondrial [Mauremys mutica]|uniref:Mitochondrial ribosomal protein L41 n=1 Tax=Mauremys mutica TaxID=74926 RepID=A0A9D3XF44_9SAUR|nr:39S ribosomal protein L41, mitochondrial [Mauremys reevesii]XP_039362161.1 39S ribosomal protein L41, mitochondrial [Mauremys reevesii]XP_039362162.1 39S ribosomal protein L41, mitochondrial [Mauremys reevesii]XP_039362163.1 39S ribosomal protein L41, mitochondrial [Mauremys reevesii]XP_039362164.1 39S ribosomal protein L41, mitochondrial [Mauremys reevesii]XP_039362165.1 39S ribosomal protein L41, mitochondrial [Mauremys reevesii]XP_039362166.1 39S ribosomal protein L41, mitochondrial [Ma